jgi:hypothetical protein
MFKACQYATNHDKKIVGLKSVSVRMHRMVYIKQLPKLKVLVNGSRSGSKLVLIVGCNIEN